jgi:hypothetical protein
VTTIETVQLEFGIIVPPVRVTLEPEDVTEPPHCEASGFCARIKLPGKLSTTPTPVNGTTLDAGLVMVKVRMEVVPTGITDGEKALVIVGGLRR